MPEHFDTASPLSAAPKRPLKVFLCHAHADRDAVRALYTRLKREGVDAWLDKEKLLPGADWEYEIRKAVREADVVVVCLSKQFNQAGFRQKEVRIALDTAMEKPEGEIFVIPARLEECDNLESLQKWHWVDLFKSDGFQRLIMALRLRADGIGATLRIRRGATTAPRPIINAEQEVAEKARLEAEELERQRAAKEQADREAAENAAREKAEKEAAEKARLQVEELERQRAAKEKEDRETAERVERERIAREAREKAKKPERPKVEKPEPKKTVSPRKPSTALIIAIIGLAGTICAVLVSLPMLADLFSGTPEPTSIVTIPTETRPPSSSKTPTKVVTPTQFFTPTATPYPNQITDPEGVTMRLVPAGEFTMGSESSNDEKPIHRVNLDAFYMDIYEVTNALYQACEDAGKCAPPQQTSSYTRSSYYGNSQFNDYPVIYVDWNQAKTYCEWRDASLPTEAQWEKAARGDDGRTYPWGEGISCSQANYHDGNKYCVGDTTEVGSYESGKSPYGIYDMAGNVWEWVADWYDSSYYGNSLSSNPLGPSSGEYRVLRGGSWYYGVNLVRSANRDGNSPDLILFNVGFRCARSLP